MPQAPPTADATADDVGLPDTHPVDACIHDDGRTMTSLPVDAAGRVTVKPAVPQG